MIGSNNVGTFTTSFTLVFAVIYLARAAPSDTGALSNLQCGRSISTGGRNRRIVGGVNAAEGEFPWIVSFKHRHSHFCGGILIEKRFVLSAAHCFYKNRFLTYNTKTGLVDLTSLNATLGEYSIKTTGESTEVPVNLKGIYLHPEYDPINKQNDIALVEISENDALLQGSVCLPEDAAENTWVNDMKVTVAGWGLRSSDQSYYDWVKDLDILQKVDIDIWDKQACLDQYKNFPNFPTKSFLCAGGEGRESCKGDSGGPLLYRRGGMSKSQWTLIGIVANGNECGRLGRPGIYTLVSDFLPWIASYTR